MLVEAALVGSVVMYTFAWVELRRMNRAIAQAPHIDAPGFFFQVPDRRLDPRAVAVERVGFTVPASTFVTKQWRRQLGHSCCSRRSVRRIRRTMGSDLRGRGNVALPSFLHPMPRECVATHARSIPRF